MRQLLGLSFLSLVLAGAAHGREAPAGETRSYCINAKFEFYEYMGGVCNAGYQLGAGNCYMPDGGFRAVMPAECQRVGGTPALPGMPLRLLREPGPFGPRNVPPPGN